MWCDVMLLGEVLWFVFCYGVVYVPVCMWMFMLAYAMQQKLRCNMHQTWLSADTPLKWLVSQFCASSRKSDSCICVLARCKSRQCSQHWMWMKLKQTMRYSCGGIQRQEKLLMIKFTDLWQTCVECRAKYNLHNRILYLPCVSVSSLWVLPCVSW